MFDLNNIWRKNALSRSLICIFTSRFQDKHQRALWSQQGQADFDEMTFSRKSWRDICFAFSSRWGKSRKIILDLLKTCTLKAAEKQVEKDDESLLAGKYLKVQDIALLKGDQKNRNKRRLSAGKIVLRKRSLLFWMVSGFESKIY